MHDRARPFLSGVLAHVWMSASYLKGVQESDASKRLLAQRHPYYGGLR